MQIKIEDFEKCLECWKTLYRLDDGIYKIILGELQILPLRKLMPTLSDFWKSGVSG
jgi:hypothetical protein